jgi:hypothetical protein
MRALALAFEIERWYSAAEATLARIVRTIDGDVPAGPTWHAELLRAASVAIDDLRPAIVSKDAATELRELLKFRHFARHGYDREPEPSRDAGARGVWMPTQTRARARRRFRTEMGRRQPTPVGPHAHSLASQSSPFSPGTRRNSRVPWVVSVLPASVMALMRSSAG